jgi:hypothetical protein
MEFLDLCEECDDNDYGNIVATVKLEHIQSQ